MAGNTPHYGLKKLAQGDHISDDSYRFSDADRDLVDSLLFLGAEGHHHTGGAAGTPPSLAPGLAVVTTAGALPAGTRAYYAYTVVDGNGVETAPSPQAFADTPAQISAPAKPTLAYVTTGGVLTPGSYYYVLSAYVGSSSFETPATNAERLPVTSSADTNVITVTFPTLPLGADGWNIYRQAPRGPGYFFLTSVASGPTTFVDDGSVAPNPDRTRPTANSTQSTNSVTVTFPGLLPAGYTRRLYRTFTAGTWTNSLLATTTAGSVNDLGGPTALGQPPTDGASIGTPARVLLTDSAEIQGRAPMSAVSAFPFVLSFSLDGLVAVVTGTGIWVCEYPQATIVGVRAGLGRGYQPAATPVIVNVNVGSGATPVMASIFTVLGDQPTVPLGAQIGVRVAPTAVSELREGDVLTVDVDQAGGGATPTDRDLVVFVYGYAYGWTSTVSHPWAT